MVEGPVTPTIGVPVGREFPASLLVVCGNDMTKGVRLSVVERPRFVGTVGAVGRTNRRLPSSSESVSVSESESRSPSKLSSSLLSFALRLRELNGIPGKRPSVSEWIAKGLDGKLTKGG